MKKLLLFFSFLLLFQNSTPQKIEELKKKIVLEGEVGYYTLFTSKIINPEKTMVFEKYNINKVVKIPVVSIGLYYKHSQLDECGLILIRIDAKTAPHKKIVKALQNKLGMRKVDFTSTSSSDPAPACEKIYDGELSIYRNKIESSLANLIKSDLKKGDEIFVKICPTKIHVIVQRIFSEKVGFGVGINNKLYCQIKKNMLDYFF